MSAETAGSNRQSTLRRRILVLDDEQSIRLLLRSILTDEGHEVFDTDDGRVALDLIGRQNIDLVIQDLRMPRMDGLTFLRQLKDRHPQVPSIVLTAFGTMETAIEAMRLGAYTHLNKPFDTEEIRLTVSRALERIQISKVTPRANVPFVDIISKTPAMREIASLVQRVAPTDSTVLITGESGTGKELIARAIHYNSLRAGQSFVPVNCGAFTETLLESELFGHVKGAFTNAIADHKGVFESADRGTLFLDEVGELTLQTQVKLLRVLETRMFKPVGGTRETKFDVRFITATNRLLPQMCLDGTFREDLFYRLNVIPIELPPLRERKEDIPLLAGHFLARFAKRMNKPVQAIDDSVVERFMAYTWPGNVRELENTLERAVALSKGERVTLEDVRGPMTGTGSHRPVGMATPLPTPLPAGESSRNAAVASGSRGAVLTNPPVLINPPRAAGFNLPPPPVVPSGGMDLEKYLLDLERSCIIQALERTDWNLTEAAKLLNMTFRSIRYRVSKLGIERPDRAARSAEEPPLA